MKKIPSGSLAAFILFLSGTLLHADVTLMRRSGSDQELGSAREESRVQISGDKYREDQFSDAGSSGPAGKLLASGGDHSTIHRLDKGVSWYLSNPNHSYAEAPIKIPNQNGSSSEHHKPLLTEAKVSVAGPANQKAINGFPCQSWTVTVRIRGDIEDTAWKQVTTFWMTPETPALKATLQEELAFEKKMTGMGGAVISHVDLNRMAFTMMQGMISEAKLKTAQTQLTQDLKAIKGYPVRVRQEWYKDGPQPVFVETTELVSVNTDPIPPAAFDLPAGFKNQAAR